MRAKILWQVSHHTPNPGIRGRQPGPADGLHQAPDLLAGLDEVEEHRKGPQFHAVGRNAGEVIGNAGQLTDQHADVLATLRCLHVKEFLDRQDKRHVVDQRRHVIEPVSVRNHLRIGMALRLFFKGSMQVADLRIAIDNGLAVQFERQVNDAMHGWM